MTEFNLTNGQAIELTKDGILIKGNRIEIDGKVIIDKDDKHITVLEEDGNKIKQSSVDIDDKLVKTKTNLNTALIKQVIDNLLNEIEEAKLQNVPHVRIEFDDIRDVPKVWVDGELIGGVDDKPLVSLKIDWNTDTETENHKGFDINYQDLTGERPMSRGFHEGSVM
jgi:hypothetical protein|nr:MAG TPA: hypothetical protein [Bacteriophage sp.]